MSYSYIYSLGAVLIVLFLAYRFGYFSNKHIGGRLPLFFGISLLLIAFVWQVVEINTEYSSWFIPSAYPIIDLVLLLVFSTAAMLVAIGFAFYADNWESKREEIESREGKLSVLENLQHDARQPYPMLELLNIALKEVMIHYPLAAGAILLVNRSRRQFILTSSTGFSKDETATLEYFPIGRNIITQSVELSDPIIFTKLDLYDHDGNPVNSRFSSGLIMPLNSGMDRLGGLLLLSDEKKYFDRSDIRTLIPVAQWLSEKVKSAKAARELAQLQRQAEKTSASLQDTLTRLSSAIAASSSTDPIAAFSKSLIGLGLAETVHIIGFEEGEIKVFGGSKPLLELSENYKTALTDALGRSKPIIINQEASQTQQEKDSISVLLSSLVSPLRNPVQKQAILLRKSGSSFVVNDNELKLLELLTGLLPMILKLNDDSQLGSFQRKGFDSILSLLQGSENPESLKTNPGYLIEHLIPVLPDDSLGMVFVPSGANKLHLVYLSDYHQDHLPNFDMGIGSGLIGSVASSHQASVVTGRGNVARKINLLTSSHNSELSKILERYKSSELMIASPILSEGKLEGIITFLVRGINNDSISEWQRFIVLAVELYSLKLMIGRLSNSDIDTLKSNIIEPGRQSVINDLNNHLSAIVGQTELVIQRTDLSLEELNLLNQVMTESEKAADCIKRLSHSCTTIEKIDAPEPVEGILIRDVSQIIIETLKRSHVSGEIYMAGQRPREIRQKIEKVGNLNFDNEEIRLLFESVLDRFATTADDDDIITIALYRRESYVYLDISRHHHNFSSVEPVAGFGQYENTRTAFANRPGDIYLRHLSSSLSYYAIDKNSANPAYLSFRFPLAIESKSSENKIIDDNSDSPVIRLLAIDDQPIILDLITAMGQSLGYHITTAMTGEEGLKLAQDHQFDILLTDLALPGLSGIEVAKSFRLIQPDKPVILVTGWDAGLKGRELSDMGITKVLYKPFRIEQLTEIVQSVISHSVL